jgi:hypothetical protein
MPCGPGTPPLTWACCQHSAPQLHQLSHNNSPWTSGQSQPHIQRHTFAHDLPESSSPLSSLALHYNQWHWRNPVADTKLNMAIEPQYGDTCCTTTWHIINLYICGTVVVTPYYNLRYPHIVKRDDSVLQLPRLLDCSHWQMSLYGKLMWYATVQGLPHRSHIMQCHAPPMQHNKTLLHVDVLSIILRICGFISTTSTDAQWESYSFWHVLPFWLLSLHCVTGLFNPPFATFNPR